MKSDGKTKVARKAIVAALSELDALSRDEYGVGLEELILSDSPGASMRLERIVGIVLKRPFATKAPPNPSGLTRARRSWPWADEDPDDQAAKAPRELAILNELRKPGTWSERTEQAEDGQVRPAGSNWEQFKDDADNERGLFKILVLYANDKVKKREGKSLREYLEAEESRKFEAGLDLATLAFDTAVIAPLVSLLGIPTLAVGISLVGIRYGYRVFTDPNVDRMGDKGS
jgi:hypothetical protein